MKHLSESAAWSKLAKLWDKPQMLHGEPCVLLYRNCICGATYELFLRGQLSKDVQNAMDDRSGEARDFTHGAYLYPLTRAGARSRAAFCRKMARLTKGK